MALTGVIGEGSNHPATFPPGTACGGWPLLAEEGEGEDSGKPEHHPSPLVVDGEEYEGVAKQRPQAP